MSSEIDDETLVAFLDGELTQSERDRVADTLEADEQLQARVAALEQTWALLDSLPTVKPNADLAQSTLELVTLEIEQESETSRRASAWLRSLLFVAMVGILVYMLGSLVGKRMTASYEDLMLSNLDLLAEYSALREIDSPEWLEKLSTIEGLTEAFPGNGIGDEIVPDDREQRARWLDQLEVVELGKLRDNVEGLRKETDERRGTLRETLNRAKSLAAPSDDESSNPLPQALAAARSYEQLLQARSSLQAEQIKSIEDLEKRELRVRQLVQSRLLTKYASEMPETDKDAIRRWVDIKRTYSPLLVLTEFDFLDEATISSQDLSDLRTSLSEEARQLLTSVDDDQNSTQQRLALSFWVDTVLNPERIISSTPEQLQETLGELLENERTANEYFRIQMLPEDQARDELREKLGVRAADVE